jgi:succinate dehydrogenase hydrophobic anchor subunit
MNQQPGVHLSNLEEGVRSDKPSSIRRILLRIALVISGLIPVLGLLTDGAASPLIYTLYVLALLNRQRLAGAFARVRLPGGVKYVVVSIISGWLTECFAWLDNYLKRSENPALLHPQLFFDLLLAIGFYGGLGICWWLVLRRWRFTLTQVFLAAGFLGIVVEQDSAVLQAIIANLANPVAAAILALYVLAVYGSAMALPYLLVEKSLHMGQRSGWLKYPVAIAGMFIACKVGFLLVAFPLSALHLIPPRLPIWEHPFF